MIDKLIGLKFIFISIEEAIKRHDIRLVKQYIKAGKKIDAVNYRGETLLYTACTFKAPDIVKLLLDNKANPNALCHGDKAIINCANTTYHIANTVTQTLEINQKVLDVINYLIQYGADINQTVDKNSLAVAVYNRNLAIVKALIKAGANTNYLDDQKNNLLHTASMSGDEDLIRMFIHLKPDYGNIENNSALHLFCKSDKDLPQVAQILLQYNANPMKRNLENQTCFENALENKLYKTAKEMIPYILEKKDLQVCEELLEHKDFDKTEILEEIKKAMFRFHLEESLEFKTIESKINKI